MKFSIQGKVFSLNIYDVLKLTMYYKFGNYSIVIQTIASIYLDTSQHPSLVYPYLVFQVWELNSQNSRCLHGVLKNIIGEKINSK